MNDEPVDEDLYAQATQDVIRLYPHLMGRVDDSATEADTGDDAAFYAAVDKRYLTLRLGHA
jgi:hypothetical protein